MNCLDLVKSFLDLMGIDNNDYKMAFSKILKKGIVDNANIDEKDGISFIKNILVETFKLNADNVKSVSNIMCKTGTNVGRAEKDLIKHFLDYKDNESIQQLSEALGIPQNSLLFMIEPHVIDFTQEAITRFMAFWNDAVENNDEKKKYDYIFSIYTHLTARFNIETSCVKDIFNYNKKFILEDLGKSNCANIETLCNSSIQIDINSARRKFYDIYVDYLHKLIVDDSNNNKLSNEMNRSTYAKTVFENLETEKYGAVYFNIDQELYDFVNNKIVFYDLCLYVIKAAYRVLDNYRSLIVKIGNIIDENGFNLKWYLYSYIGIYAEHFIPYVNKGKYYTPESLAIDKMLYNGIDVTDELKADLIMYYKGLESLENLQNKYPYLQISNYLMDFEKTWMGYTFSDCLILKGNKHEQSKDLNGIDNLYEIAFVFNKYRLDERKVPCPDCAGLKISGNSYPEVGLKSWECKNDICPSRSKSNRGKRYSAKSNFMQFGYDDGVDIIEKDFIKQWRRDVVDIKDEADFSNMLIKYFSFSKENILFINTKSLNNKNILGRLITEITIDKNTTNISKGIYEEYFVNKAYLRRCYEQKEYSLIREDVDLNNNISQTDSSILINGDSRVVLGKIKEDTFAAAVTSPPYYNARLYSQWPNLYLYISDMYEIVKETYRTLKPGAIYLYNIGDICGNENTVVSSNMGNKRILLGAYTINMFLEAGFELLDNIIWDKGEPQSNRQKNDGKFTPFYQKPMNVYEHMFIFKKPGGVVKNTNNIIWNSNIATFIPVFKINCKGENILGHTAPYPLDIPDFVCKAFMGKGDVLLEPFAGSGTSIISANNNHVKCIGIELSSEYCDLIKDICSENHISLKYLKA